MSGSLGRDHCNVNVRGRNDLTEVDAEAVSEHKHIASLKVGLDVLLVHSCLLLVVDKDHNDVSLLCSVGGCVNLKALLLGSCP